MPIQKYNTASSRIGKLKGEILSHAIPKEVLGLTGTNKDMPMNVSDTVVFRRWLPFGGVDNQWITGSNVDTFAPDALIAEGITPTADTLAPTDITATLLEYGVLYSVSNRTVDLFEDDVPAEMKIQTGQRVGLIREMVRYGELKGATNAFFAGGTTRGTVDETLSLNLLRRVTKSLLANHGMLITSVLSPSPNYATAPVEAGFLVFCSTDMEPAIRNLPGFKHVVDYGQRKVVSPDELGSCERFRFILSPELAAYIDSGAAVGATGLYSTGAANIDVYPCIVCAEDAWGQVALRGKTSLDVTWIPPKTKDKNDPLGQRGYVGASFYHVAVILNQGWMAVVEAGTPNLA
jgi:N4-gp56 family major capsid protein